MGFLDRILRRPSKEQRLVDRMMAFARMTQTEESTLPMWNTSGRRYGRSSEQIFKEYSEEDLGNLDDVDLTDLMIKNDPTANRAWDDATLYGALSVQLTCENPRGQRILDDMQMVLDKKRNGLRGIISKLLTSILARGDMFSEVILGPKRRFENIVVVDPKYAYFENRKRGAEGLMPVLGQYFNGTWKPLTSENVFYQSVNAYLDDPKGTSVLTTAFPSLISDRLVLQDLRKVVKNHAWLQRLIAINQIGLMEAGYKLPEIEKIVEKDKADIQKHWGGGIDPEETPVMTGEVEFRQYEGASGGRGLQFIDTIDRIHDRKTLRGIKATPFNMGSNEFIAESSAEAQMILWGIRVNVYQDMTEGFVARNARVPLLLAGITEPAVCTIQRMKDWQRLEQAQIFSEVVTGVTALVSAGVPLAVAFQVFEDITDQTLSDAVRAKIEKVIMDSDEEGMDA